MVRRAARGSALSIVKISLMTRNVPKLLMSGYNLVVFSGVATGATDVRILGSVPAFLSTSAQVRGI